MTLQSNALSEHEGKISGLETAIAAVQSSLSSWVAVVIGIAGVLFAAFAVVATIEISWQGRADAHLDRLDSATAEINAKADRMIDRLTPQSNVYVAPPTTATAGNNQAASAAVRR
jgi:hypothetical protein